MRRLVSALIVALAFVVAGRTATASGASQPCDPAGGDAAAIAAARADVALYCPCGFFDGSDGKRHADYAACAAERIKLAVTNEQLNPSCVRSVETCAAKSTCGAPGSVTCCVRTPKGKVKCTIKAAASKCIAPKDGTACVGPAASICDSVDSVNDPPCFVPPDTCTSATDPITAARWVVCDADATRAWVSGLASPGTYRADLICQALGYTSIGRYGGTCNDVCGACGNGDSCRAPGVRAFDGSTGCALPQVCGYVMWECSR